MIYSVKVFQLKDSDNLHFHRFASLEELKKFNYANIYSKAHSSEMIENYKHMFETLFNKLLDIIDKQDENHSIYKNYLNSMSKEYLKNTSNARKVIDYIAGMTDEYFLNEYKKYQD